MKIAFLNITQGLVNRGAETFVREVAQRLEKNHEVVILRGSKAPPPRWPLLWRTFFDPNGLIIAWFTLRNIGKIWQEKFDVIFPLNGGWQAVIVRLVTWLYGGKIIISGQSGKGWDDRINLFTFPNAFVAISQYLTKWAEAVNPFIKTVYIPNGVNLELFKSAGVKASVNLEHPVILCVGALTSGKRIELAIHAVMKLDKGNLVVIGDGPRKNQLVKLGKQLLGERFFLTSAAHKEMPKWYRIADVFTLPSPWYRSFEIVLVEAMATNVPVVANDDPIRREIVGDGGLLIDPTNINIYASTLQKALDTKWDNKPRKQAEKFSWEIIVKKYEQLFQELIK